MKTSWISRLGRMLGLAALACSASSAVAQEYVIRSIGHLSADFPHSAAKDVSDDGKVVVGISNVAQDESYGFRWTLKNGVRKIGTLDGLPGRSSANAVNADGSVIVGAASKGSSSRAYRLVWGGALTDLGGAGNASAADVSADGSVVVGYTIPPADNTLKAIRWTAATGMQQLGAFGGDGFGFAHGVSADGRLVSGRARAADGVHQMGFRWNVNGSMSPLGTVANVTGSSVGNAISHDGEIVVGQSDTPAGKNRAAIWRPGTGMKSLGTIDGFDGISGANDMSTDASVIVGWSETSLPGGEACIWIDETPIQLWTYLQDLGVDLTGWNSLDEIAACTPNGRTLVGVGVYRNATSAFIVSAASNADDPGDGGDDDGAKVEMRPMAPYCGYYAQATFQHADAAIAAPRGATANGYYAYVYAYYGYVYALYAGDGFQWGGSTTRDEAYAAYADLRYGQYLFDLYAMHLAEARFYESPDEASLYCYIFALYANAYAGYDLGI